MAFHVGVCKFSKLNIGNFKSLIRRSTTMQSEESEDEAKTGIFNNIKRRFRRRFTLSRSGRCKLPKSNSLNYSSNNGCISVVSHESINGDSSNESIPDVSNEMLDPSKQSLTRHLLQLSKYGWYWGPMTREEADEKLSGQPEGSFLVRDSSNDHFLLSVSFRSSGRTFHSRIYHHAGKFSFYQSESMDKEFNSIPELVEHSIYSSQSTVFCYSRPTRPGHPSFPVRLLKPVSRSMHVRSLQYLCRFVIRQHTRVDQIKDLPLPSKICDYIEQGQF